MAITRTKVLSATLALVSMLLGAQLALADHFVFPSTNDENRDKGWAHVNLVDQNVGEATLEFVSERSFFSCFEYRTDGDTSQATSDTNFNPNAHGLYPFHCENNSSSEMTFEADEYVEVRMVFGAEGDERFDWTRFDVLPKAQVGDCENGGWESLGFSSERQCIVAIIRGDVERPDRSDRSERGERSERSDRSDR